MSGLPFVKPTSDFDRQSLGKYELLCRLSTGGMSEIFLATQKGLHGFRKIVVLKSILPDIRGEDEFVKMFLEEARTTAAFNHPNIAQVFDLDTDDDTLFLSMEFVQGCTLVEMARACRQAKEPIPIGFTLQAVRDTALALHYAHNFTDPRGRRQVVIHRDVAEKNIMMSYEGITKLLDFGIAKALGGKRASMTSVGMVKGTSGYMSPEQIRGEPLDPRSDVFALGVVLHECLTAMRLFHGKNAEDGMLAALREDVQPPSRLNSDVSAALDQVTLKALARDREHRFTTALEFAREIEKACPGEIWHPEQSGELVLRHYSERRQQTRELIERAQGTHDTTGELKLDKVLAVVNQRSGPVPGAVPDGKRSTGAAAPPRKSGPTTPELRITAAPAPAAPVKGHDTTLPASTAGLAVNLTPAGFEEDDDDSGMKTIPAASLPKEFMEKMRATHPRSEIPTFVPAVAGPTLTPAPVARTYSRESENTNTATTGPGGPPPGAGKFDFEDDDDDVGIKTAISRPFEVPAPAPTPPRPPPGRAVAGPAQTHDESAWDGEEPGAAPELGAEPTTNSSGDAQRPLGVGKLIGFGALLAFGALAAALWGLGLPPFVTTAPKPPPATRLPLAPQGYVVPAPTVVAEAKPVEAKPAEVKPVEVKSAEVKSAEVKPAEVKSAEVKSAEVKPAEEKPAEEKPAEEKPAEEKPAEVKVDKAPPQPPPKQVAVAEPPRREPKRREREKKRARPDPANDAAPTTLGNLQLVVEPPVHVFFGGKDLGLTPLKAAQLPVGKQKLKLVPLAGPSKTLTVDVKEGNNPLRVDLEDL